MSYTGPTTRSMARTDLFEQSLTHVLKYLAPWEVARLSGVSKNIRGICFQFMATYYSTPALEYLDRVYQNLTQYHSDAEIAISQQEYDSKLRYLPSEMIVRIGQIHLNFWIQKNLSPSVYTQWSIFLRIQSVVTKYFYCMDKFTTRHQLEMEMTFNLPGDFKIFSFPFHENPFNTIRKFTFFENFCFRLLPGEADEKWPKIQILFSGLADTGCLDLCRHFLEKLPPQLVKYRTKLLAIIAHAEIRNKRFEIAAENIIKCSVNEIDKDVVLYAVAQDLVQMGMFNRALYFANKMEPSRDNFKLRIAALVDKAVARKALAP
jgi:hypothetical protein